MYLIVCLGNPEADYSNTRHNMGFNVANKIAEKYGIDITKKKFKGLLGSGTIDGNKVLILKPQTFMNLSGESVIEVVNYYHLPDETQYFRGVSTIGLEGSQAGYTIVNFLFSIILYHN